MNELDSLIQGPSGQLQIKFHKGQSDTLFVMCHPHPLYQGTMDNKVVTMAIKALFDLGFSTLRFNYRGVGKSEGAYGHGVGETEDLLCVIDWAKQHMGFDRLILGGFSFGCYVAYRGAGILHPDRLLMVAPAIAHMDFSILPVPDMPYLVIQGGADEVVSAEATYEFVADHANSPLITLEKLPNVGHFFHGELIRLKELIQEYFKKNDTY